jgi:hypothetical protein
LKNGKDLKLYNELVSNTKTRDATPEEIEQFKELCENAPLNEPVPATLDNIFVKGFNKNMTCEIHENSSDHVAIFASIEL